MSADGPPPAGPPVADTAYCEFDDEPPAPAPGYVSFGADDFADDADDGAGQSREPPTHRLLAALGAQADGLDAKASAEDVGDWNGRFLAALDLPEDSPRAKEVKYSRLSNVAADFVYCAESYGQIIISQFYLPVQLKTIKPTAVGGVAGGEKFLVNNILFKLARDNPKYRIYNGSDEHAARSAGHDLRGLVQVHEAMLARNVRGLNVPLEALIDYRGHRLIAMALLPLSPNSPPLMGSNDGGRHVYAEDDEMAEQMEALAERLYLEPHYVVGKKLYAGADVEGHRGRDGRLYLIDCARIFPPEHPAAASHLPRERNSVFWRLLRPELVKRFGEERNLRLSPDALSMFGKADPQFHLQCQNVKLATRMLFEVVVPEFAEVLRATASLNSLSLTEEMHHRGINMRHLGLIRSHLLDCAPAAELLLVSLLVRTLKNVLRDCHRQVLRSLKAVSRHAFDMCTVDFLNLVSGSHDDSDDFWRLELPEEVRRRFGHLALSPKEELDLRGAVGESLGAVLLGLMAAMSIELTPTSTVALQEAPANFRFFPADIVLIGTRLKHMSIVESAQGHVLSAHAIDRSGPASAQSRLYAISAEKLQSSRGLAKAYAESLIQRIGSLAQLSVEDLQQIYDGHIDLWRSMPEFHEIIGQQFVNRGEPLMASDVLKAGLSLLPSHGGMRQLLALAQAQAGFTHEAISQLQRLIGGGDESERTMGVLARCYKDLAEKAGTLHEYRQHLGTALRLYSSSFDSGGRGSYYPGINAASMAFLLNRQEESRQLAAEVIALCSARLEAPDASGGEMYWLLSTLGEANFILGQYGAAEDHYRSAVSLAPTDYVRLKSTHGQLLKLLKCVQGREMDSGLQHVEDDFASVVNLVAVQLHSQWQQLRGKRLDGTFEPRVKVVGGRSYDIANMSYHELPDAFKIENLQSAEVACYAVLNAIKAQRPLDDVFYERACLDVHQAWLERNREGAWDESQQLPEYGALPDADRAKLEGIVQQAAAIVQQQCEVPPSLFRQTSDLRIFNQVFDTPCVIAFLPLRSGERALAAAGAEVAAALDQTLERLNCGFGVGQLAPGLSTLFLEAVLRRPGAEAHVCLSVPLELLVQSLPDSVQGRWGARMEAVLQQATRVVVTNDLANHDSVVNSRYCDFTVNGLAAQKAAFLGNELKRLLPRFAEPSYAGVVLGAPRRAQHHDVDSSNWVVQQWARQRLARHYVELPYMEPDVAAGPPATAGWSAALGRTLPPQVLRTLLYMQLVGPAFREESMVELMDVLRHAGAHGRPRSCETAGRSVHLLFDRVQDAGVFALEVLATVAQRDAFELKTSLHVAPLSMNGAAFFGAHQARAEQIMGAAPPGSVYCSQAYASFVTTLAIAKFQCNYMGHLLLSRKETLQSVYMVSPLATYTTGAGPGTIRVSSSGAAAALLRRRGSGAGFGQFRRAASMGMSVEA